MRKIKRLLAVALAGVLVTLMLPVSVSAAIADPDTIAVNWGGVYRNYLEEDDQLYVASFTIDYTVNPTEGTAYDLFVARLMNGASELGAVRPYAYYDEGYDYGIVAIYFSAADVTDNGMGWGAGTGYSIKLQGDPLQDWVSDPIPSSTLGAFGVWYDGGSVADTTSALTTRLRVMGLEAENAWNPGTLDIIERIAGVNKLTAEGEDYFITSIPNIRTGCPDLFSVNISSPVYDENIVVNDYYSIGEDAGVSIYGVNWYAQTFTATNSYNMTGVWLRLYRVGTPGDVTVSVRATAADLPTGADTADGTLASTDVTLLTAGGWYQMTFDTEIALERDTVYSLVVRALGGDAANYIAWLVDTAGAYDGGRAASSGNSGAAWAGVAANDTMFINEAFNAHTMSFVKQREGFLIGTPFDLTGLAATTGISRLYLGGFFWFGFSLIVAYFITRKANSFKPLLVILAIMAPFGGYLGFMNLYVALLVAGVIGLGAIYVIAYNKAP